MLCNEDDLHLVWTRGKSVKNDKKSLQGSRENIRMLGQLVQPVPSDCHPYSLLMKHCEAVSASRHSGKKNFLNSDDFEMLMVDYLLHLGAPPRSIVMHLGKKGHEGRQIGLVYQAEIDILLCLPPYAVALHMKTSFRERWRQAERDAIFFQNLVKGEELDLLSLWKPEASKVMPCQRHYVIGYREYPANRTDEWEIDHFRGVQSRSLALAGACSILDAERMMSLSSAIASKVAESSQ